MPIRIINRAQDLVHPLEKMIEERERASTLALGDERRNAIENTIDTMRPGPGLPVFDKVTNARRIGDGLSDEAVGL